jgi:hypothetical protein
MSILDLLRARISRSFVLFITICAAHAMLFMAPLSVRADECLRYDEYPGWIGGLRTVPDRAMGVAVAGNHAYLVGFNFGLRVIEISNPAAPQSVALTGGIFWDVAVSGPYAYMTPGGNNVQAWNISNPSAPVLSGQATLPGGAYRLVVNGNRAYVTGGVGLAVLDLSFPGSPTFLGRVDTPGEGRDVAVLGQHAYVADGAAGLQVIDVTDPSLPILVTTLPIPGSARAVQASGNHVYVAGGEFRVVDVTNPANPVVIGSINPLGHANDLAVEGNTAYFAGEMQITFIDVTNPSAPALKGAVDTPGVIDGPQSIALAGSLAYLADDDGGLQILDVSPATSPPAIGTLTTEAGMAGIDVAGTFAYVAAQYPSGLLVVDVADPSSPSLTGTAPLPATANDVAVLGNHAYVAADLAGLQVVDVSVPSAPVVVGAAPVACCAYGVAVSGNIACVAAYNNGIHVYDVSSPSSPVLLGSTPVTGTILDVAISGNYVFAAARVFGLQVIDISNPSSPVVIGNLETPGETFGVTVVGDYAYLADRFAGPHVVDISDPAHASLVWSGGMHYLGNDIAVRNGRAYVADGGLQTIDVAVPESPSLIGRADTGLDMSVAIAADDQYVYVASGFAGMAIFAAQCPAIMGVSVASPGAPGVRLFDPAPNPTFGSTQIAFEVSGDAATGVQVGVYDLAGRFVQRLFSGELGQGRTEIRWNGLNHAGERSPSGIYFIHLNSEGIQQAKRVVILK